MIDESLMRIQAVEKFLLQHQTELEHVKAQLRELRARRTVLINDINIMKRELERLRKRQKQS